MAKRSFALEAGGPKRLDLTWKGLYREITVSLDGQTLGVIPSPKALAAGQEFSAPDGSSIRVQLVSKFYGSEWRVSRNGQPLPGSSLDPQTRLRNAYQTIYFIAGLNLVLGLITLVLDVEVLKELGLGFSSMIFGLVFLALGFFVQRKSSVALVLAIGLLALDGIAGFILSIAAGANPGIGGLLIRGLLLVPMVQGVGAIKMLKAGALQPSVIG